MRLCRRRRQHAIDAAMVALPPSIDFVGGAIERQDRCVCTGLVARIQPDQRGGDGTIDVGDGAADAETAQDGPAIPQVDRLDEAATRRACRGDASPAVAIGKPYIDFDRGPAARIPDPCARTCSMRALMKPIPASSARAMWRAARPAAPDAVARRCGPAPWAPAPSGIPPATCHLCARESARAGVATRCSTVGAGLPVDTRKIG